STHSAQGIATGCCSAMGSKCTAHGAKNQRSLAPGVLVRLDVLESVYLRNVVVNVIGFVLRQWHPVHGVSRRLQLTPWGSSVFFLLALPAVGEPLVPAPV